MKEAETTQSKLNSMAFECFVRYECVFHEENTHSKIMSSTGVLFCFAIPL